MAGDTNKNSAADTKANVSEAKVGDGGQSAHRYRFKLPKLPTRRVRKRTLFITLLAVLIIVIGGVLLLSKETHVGDKVYAQAAGHKIYKEDVDKLMDGNKSVTQHQAATALADKYLAQAMAKKEHVTLSDQDVQKAYGSSINSQKTHNPYAYQTLVNQAYFAKLQVYSGGVYKGYLLVAQFSRYISFVPGLNDGDPNMNNPQAIAADRKYAQNFITGLYNQVKAGKITWDQAAQKEMKDPTVGTKMYPTLSHSGPFDTSQVNLRRNDLIKPSSISSTISSMKAGQISKPFVVSTTSAGSDDQIPTYYLVVRMDSVAGGKSTVSFAQELSQAKQQFGYKVYV